MKRREKTTESGGIFKIFEPKKKPQVGGELPTKTIRHLERPVNLPFLKDMDEDSLAIIRDIINSIEDSREENT